MIQESTGPVHKLPYAEPASVTVCHSEIIGHFRLLWIKREQAYNRD